MREDNTIQIICKEFALRIIKLYVYLKDNKQEYVLSKQVLRSGTSIGANARESINAQSSMDFINKLNIALKEANETQYWFEVMLKSSIINDIEYTSINNDLAELLALLTTIIKTSKKKQLSD